MSETTLFYSNEVALAADKNTTLAAAWSFLDFGHSDETFIQHNRFDLSLS